MPKQFSMKINDKAYERFTCRESAAGTFSVYRRDRGILPEQEMTLTFKFGVTNAQAQQAQEILTYLSTHIPYATFAVELQKDTFTEYENLIIRVAGTCAQVYSALWWAPLFVRLLLDDPEFSLPPQNLMKASRLDPNNWYYAYPSADRENAITAYSWNIDPLALLRDAPRGPASFIYRYDKS